MGEKREFLGVGNREKELKEASKQLPSRLLALMDGKDEAVFDVERLVDVLDMRLKEGLLKELAVYADLARVGERGIKIKLRPGLENEESSTEEKTTSPKSRDNDQKTITRRNSTIGYTKEFLEKEGPFRDDVDAAKDLDKDLTNILKEPEAVLAKLNSIPLNTPVKFFDLASILGIDSRPLLYEILNSFTNYQMGNEGVIISEVRESK